MYYCIQDSHSNKAWDRDLRCVACYAFGELALSQSWFCILRIDILNKNVNLLFYLSFSGNFLTCQDQCAGSDEVLNSLPNGMLPSNIRTIKINCFKFNFIAIKFPLTLYGLISRWMFWWSFKILLSAKAALQPGCEHLKGFSSLWWINLCRFILCE